MNEKTNETKVTPVEALRIISNRLGQINIPVGMIEQVGLPLARCINDINACVNVLDECDLVPKHHDTPEEEEREPVDDLIPEEIDLGTIDLGEDGKDA